LPSYRQIELHLQIEFTGNNNDGNGNTDLSGGEEAADNVFDDLTGGISVTDDRGHRVGPNNVRRRTGRDGRPRVDIPAPSSGNRGPETIHFNP